MPNFFQKTALTIKGKIYDNNCQLGGLRFKLKRTRTK